MLPILKYFNIEEFKYVEVFFEFLRFGKYILTIYIYRTESFKRVLSN